MKASKKRQTVTLADFVENPRNPSTATDEDITRLAGKLKRVPLGLTAMRIAYVTDMDGDERTRGKCVVISGNKRLRVLKKAYGEGGRIPADWVQDVTAMSEAERHEFIIDANVSDGSWDVDTLMADYDRAELGELLKPGEIDAMLQAIDEPAADVETFDDLANGNPATEGLRCQIGRLHIPITQEEADLLTERYEAYVKRQTCGFGFFLELLDGSKGGKNAEN